MKQRSIRHLLIGLVIVDCLLCGIFISVKLSKNTSNTKPHISETNIQRICELATLECFYHNAHEWSDAGNIIGYGERKLWIEYDGIVQVGINAGQIEISEPDANDVITVTIPEAIILDKDLDENSIKEIDSQKLLLGFIQWSSVSAEHRRPAFAEAQEKMVTKASQNGTILDEAQERAKLIIEKTLISIGEDSGKQYKIKFVSVPSTQTSFMEKESQ